MSDQATAFNTAPALKILMNACVFLFSFPLTADGMNA